ncbi:hypothetical protein PDESU_00215 [Pontiella desulfatans]|uniref:SET domain-containing protein n=1 Tax=Pontiella desulfatans TaxID=2750659 RepID=A0A6C2TVJ6_PONDE|nr:SET domain-containing protein [Pontiella desulfatans]VGO11670.1 hypothetical protein PDESU_00215 [Pontiella desulfatans]
MIHPETELRFVNPEIGHGVFATGFIPKGTIVWVQDALDRTLPPEEVGRYPADLRERMLKYCFRDRHGHFVLCWDHNRYVNHSFDSNCILTPYQLEIAVRDIQPGEELTDNYGYLNIIEPFDACDEGHARKTVFPDDLTRHHPEWDNKLEGAYGRLAEVEQPLRGLLGNEAWETLLLIANGEAAARSIRECFYDPA